MARQRFERQQGLERSDATAGDDHVQSVAPGHAQPRSRMVRCRAASTARSIRARISRARARSARRALRRRRPSYKWVTVRRAAEKSRSSGLAVMGATVNRRGARVIVAAPQGRSGESRNMAAVFSRCARLGDRQGPCAMPDSREHLPVAVLEADPLLEVASLVSSFPTPQRRRARMLGSSSSATIATCRISQLTVRCSSMSESATACIPAR